MTEKEVSLDGGVYTFECPNCDGWIEVPINQVNCHIFRHAYYFSSLPNGSIVLTEQLNPHASLEVCEKLLSENRIVGCAKPFRLEKQEEKYVAKQCGYI